MIIKEELLVGIGREMRKEERGGRGRGVGCEMAVPTALCWPENDDVHLEWLQLVHIAHHYHR